MSFVSKFTRQRLVILSIGLAVILFLAINLIASHGMRTARVDLTDQNLFSLSQGSRQLLANMNEPIHMRLFLSENLLQSAPQLASYARRVRAMLDTYADLSNGMILLEIIDPKPFSDDEDRAVGLGVNRFQVNGTGDPVFFGLAATNSTAGKAEIPVFSPNREAFLEYDLTRLIADLGQSGKPVVAMLDGLGLTGSPMAGSQEQQVVTQMREFFDVKLIDGEIDTLPENTRVVMVVHPQSLSDRTLYTLDQWVLGGGATIVFADPHAETQQGPRPGMPQADAATNFDKLFAAWDVGFDPTKAVGDPVYALRTTRTIGNRQVDVANYPWIGVRPDGMERSDAILNQLSSIVLTTAGAFTKKGDDIALKPLLTASDEAGLISTTEAASPFGDPRQLLSSLQKPKDPLVLAARLTGSLKTAFPDGKPEGSDAKGEPLKQLNGRANVILVGDADMLMDRNWMRRQQIFGQTIARAFANNGDFVINALEQMSGGVALADLRGRGISWRPFERIASLEKEAESRYLAKEQALLKRLQDTEAKIHELNKVEREDGNLISPETLAAVEQFRAQMLATRAELRDVQYQLRRDVEQLKSWVTAANVGVIPTIVALLTLIIALRRPSRPIPTTADR